MFNLSQVAQPINAVHYGKDVHVSRVVCDSRNVAKGDLFVALKGETFDAHDFVEDAFHSGAAAAMISSDSPINCSGPSLSVKGDTRQGFGRLASWWRNSFDIPIIAVTGSNGKTTVKEMLSSILGEFVGSEKVLSTFGNLNNDIGVPMTLLRLRQEHRFAVIEMGMNHKGEIGYLSEMTTPTIGLINNAGLAHVGQLGTIMDVVSAKGELLKGLKQNAHVVLNKDDANIKYWLKFANDKSVTTFGFSKDSNVTGTYKVREGSSEIKISLLNKNWEIILQLPGAHNVRNALAAATAASLAGVPPEIIVNGLQKYKGISGRLNTIILPRNICLYDDSYNANPDSVKAAIEVLSAKPGDKIFVMGEMGELGEAAPDLHRKIGIFAKEKRIDRLLGIGNFVNEAVRGFGEGAVHYRSMQSLFCDLRKYLHPSCTILVKGSRSEKLDILVTKILDFSKLNFSESD